MPELTITSPYVHSRVDNNTFTLDNPMLESSRGIQALDNLDFFFLPKSNPYMPFVNFRKKFCFTFDFNQNFDVQTFLRWLSIRGTELFLRDIQKNFFFKIFTLVLLDRFLDGFSKFGFFIGEICILNRDFWVIFEFIACVCWAYAETILSHAEHTRNRFHRMLSIRGPNFHACSASGKIVSAYAQHFYMYNLCWAYAERILSHTEHTEN
jgi:hypothetical protein